MTLTGNAENISDNADVFGYGTDQRLTDKSFVETFIVNTSAVNAFGPQTSTGVSSNSIFGGSPPYAVGGTLTINGRSFSTAGSNYSSLYTMGDYQILSNDMVRGSGDNNFYVDLTGAGFPATVDQPISLALAAGQAANVSFIDNNSGGEISAAIGNLYPTQLTVSVAAAVPEPSIWGAMILGFGMVGASIRRRNASIGLI
ncbi:MULTISPECIES: PEPxxWA-CTERM sorting domain-containing protein [Sphingosinicellaceae]|uniref:PEPxxWA-CTERM sorting domain-containing protein n=1 Tax=Sphingosinicellaceae TaxID=2820280 RepID=UPI001D006F48|nr:MULTISPECIES: PEPxxWA-CTERM sorting domain-containing protein [Polymorphobacter]